MRARIPCQIFLIRIFLSDQDGRQQKKWPEYPHSHILRLTVSSGQFQLYNSYFPCFSAQPMVGTIIQDFYRICLCKQSFWVCAWEISFLVSLSCNRSKCEGETHSYLFLFLSFLLFPLFRQQKSSKCWACSDAAVACLSVCLSIWQAKNIILNCS